MSCTTLVKYIKTPPYREKKLFTAVASSKNNTFGGPEKWNTARQPYASVILLWKVQGLIQTIDLLFHSC